MQSVIIGFLRNGGSFNNKIKLEPTIEYINGVRNIFFKHTLTKDDTVYFVFYLKKEQTFTDIASVTVNVNKVLTDPVYGNTDKLSILLHQKFGFFYSCYYFLSDFWAYINNLEEVEPDFSITLPDFLGGGTFDVFDFGFYDKYRTFIHYILAGFIYFFYFKNLINKVSIMLENFQQKVGVLCQEIFLQIF